MTEKARHYFGAHRYIPVQHIVIPFEDRFILGTAYGTHRTFKNLYTGPDLLTHLTDDFNHQLALSESQRRHSEAIAAERQAHQEIIESIDLSSITLDL